MKNSKLIRVPPTAPVPSLGSLVTEGYGDLGSQLTPALLAGDTHQTQPLFTPPACQCLTLTRGPSGLRPGTSTLRRFK